MTIGSFWNWMHGAFYGFFFGLVMSVYNIGKSPDISLRKIVTNTVVSSIFVWFAVGLWESFGWRAFQIPLIFLTIASGMCGFFISWSGGRRG
ncbi:MAG: hypothetical protein ABR874_16935 [Candidatus Sulfotelmatobacter sp.]|jgi:hypothetical protein